MRVFVPLTVPDLRTATVTLKIQPPNGIGFGVSAQLRAEYPAADDDELEFLAQTDAALTSLRLLGSGDAGWLRVVIAADVPSAESAPELDRSAVRLAAPIPWRDVAAVYVDGAESEPVVRAGALRVDAAELGDPDAEIAVGDVQDIDLCWYSPGEIRYLLDDLDGPQSEAGAPATG